MISKIAITFDSNNIKNFDFLINHYKKIDIFDFVFVIHESLKQSINLNEYSSGQVCFCNEKNYILKIAEIFKDIKEDKYCALLESSFVLENFSFIDFDEDAAIDISENFVVLGKPDFWSSIFEIISNFVNNFDFIKNNSSKFLFENIIKNFSINYLNLKEKNNYQNLLQKINL